MLLLQPTYFSSIAQYAAIYGEKEILFEFEDNYQKQTYRNRCYISGANGKQLLNIPIKHNKGSRKTKTRDIQIDYKAPLWYKNHLKTLQAAYRSSPFYEYYEHDIITIFNKTPKFLLDLNIDIHEFVMEILQQKSNFKRTKRYDLASDYVDLRQLSNAKQELQIDFPSYTQMFDEKYGFQQNLSIVDLLFMEGPASYKYLQSIPKITI